MTPADLPSEQPGLSTRRVAALPIARHWPELLVALIWCASIPAIWNLTLGPDMAWQLWIARHMNAGVPLYDWIVETNPPLWFWMAQPVSLVASALDISPNSAQAIAVWLLAGCALALSCAVIRDLPVRARAAVLGSICAGIFVLVMTSYGQREHEALIGIIPYTLLVTRRVEGRTVSWILALAIGIFAAPMIALKHYFVLLPVLLEIWLMVRTRRLRPFRPETLCLGIGAVAYAGAVIAFTPRYLTEIVPAVSMAYGNLRMPLNAIFDARLLAPLVLAGFYIWHFRRALPDITQAMLVVTGAFVLSHFAQWKGFGYHIDPVVAALMIAVLTHVFLRPPPFYRVGAGPLALAGALVLTICYPAVATGPYRNANDELVTTFLRGYGPGVSVAPLIVRTPFLWPMVANEEVKLPLRYYHFWMLDAVADREARGEALPPALAEYVQKVRLQTVDDMLCNPPDIIIEDTIGLFETKFDMLGFFLREPRFAEVFEAYEPAEPLSVLNVYRRVSDLPPPTGLTCMRIGTGLAAPQ